MKYYAIYDARSDTLLAEGTARECRKKLGCSSIDTFYALISRSHRGINKKYRVEIKNGGETDYPVLGAKSDTDEDSIISLRYRFVPKKKK